MPFWKNDPRTSRPRPGCLDASALSSQRPSRPVIPALVAGPLRPLLAVALACALEVVLAAGPAVVRAQPLGPIVEARELGQNNPLVRLLDLPPALVRQQGRQLVLERRKRRLLLLEDGVLLDLFPVAIGRPGWETPLGSFAVLEKIPNPTWQHPQRPLQIGAGPSNPLGSRWIGFWRDFSLRKPWEGQRPLAVASCAAIGFHGTPQRGSVGRAVSHGCVRLYDEDVRRLYELVELGTPVTVLP